MLYSDKYNVLTTVHPTECSPSLNKTNANSCQSNSCVPVPNQYTMIVYRISSRFIIMRLCPDLFYLNCVRRCLIVCSFLRCSSKNQPILIIRFFVQRSKKIGFLAAVIFCWLIFFLDLCCIVPENINLNIKIQICLFLYLLFLEY
jgi:hypothetical protein